VSKYKKSDKMVHIFTSALLYLHTRFNLNEITNVVFTTYIHTFHGLSVEVTTGCGISHNIQIYSYTGYRILHLNTIN
jgi:hypothetical protein